MAKITLEYKFKGTPAQFYAATRDFFLQNKKSEFLKLFRVFTNVYSSDNLPVPPDLNPVEIYLDTERRFDENYRVCIKAIQIPNNQSEITVIAQDDADLELWWEPMQRKLIEQGWLGDDKNSAIKVVNSGRKIPKTDKALERWKQAYEIITETRKHFREAWEEAADDNPSPKIEDYRDALADGMNWNPSDRTIRSIRNAGDSGDLT